MSAAPISPKAVHYHTALGGALLRGAWAEANPGAEPNGSELSWGELVRKWGKHTGGNTALIHHIRDISLLYLSSTAHPSSSSGSASVIQASQSIVSSPRATTSIVDGPNSRNSSTEGVSHSTNASTSGSSFIHVPHPHLRHKTQASLDGTPVGAQATSSGSTIRQSTIGMRATSLSAKDLDGDDAQDETSWGEGRGRWAGVGSEHEEEVKESARALEGLITGGNLRPPELHSARMTLAYHLHALGLHEAAMTVFSDADPGQDPKLGVVQGDAAVLERIRSRCLRGVSLEHLRTSDPHHALQSYLSVIPLARSLSSFPFPLPPYLVTPPAQTPKLPFETHRELHRQLSTSLSRASIISARMPNALSQTLRILRTYNAYSTCWSTGFRPRQRQRMLQLYLRELLAGYPEAGAASDSPYLLGEGTTTLPARAMWRKEVSEAIRIGRNLLSATTSFPRAGSINTPVTAFTYLCVALAKKCPLLSREAISVLWWAQTLTFQSQSLLRHLTRLLALVGDSDDARRTFELYVQLVLKSRQTQQPDVNLQLKRHSTEGDPADPRELQRQAGEAQSVSGGDTVERKAETADAEIDNDEEFIGALLVGSRLMLRDLHEAEEAWRYSCLAGDVVSHGNRRGRGVTAVLRAQIEECKGIVRMSMATSQSDPATRPTYQAQSINHLIAATRLDSTSSTAFYHLAFCQAEARSIESATESVHNALELDSRNIQFWHLLALLFTAQSDWAGAAKAGEAGVSVWEQGDESDRGEDEGPLGNPSESNPAVEVTDFAATPHRPNGTGQTSSATLLQTSGAFTEPHLSSTPMGASPLSRAKRLEEVIQLRMTLNTITEKTQGPDAAMIRQQELFAFFSARSGKQRNQGYLRGMPGAVSTTSFVEKGLGESFVSVDQPGPGRNPASLVSDGQVPPPSARGLADQPLPQIEPPVVVHAANSSLDSSAASSDFGMVEKGAEKDGHRSVSGGRRLLSKHLHVPHPISTRSPRPSNVRRMSHPPIADLALHRTRTASASSIALSVAPTAVHSHFHHCAGRTPPPPPPSQATVDHGRTPAEARILSNLWLMSAATFRRWGKLDQCLVSIEEAEVLDPENADVWVQLGLYHVSTSPPNYDAALPAFTKSLLLRPDHPPAVVSLAKLYISTGQVELAHTLLNQLTQDAAWDVPEAWYYLGKVCEAQERHERARECWIYALGLEESRPARRWGDAGDRWL